MWLPVMMLASWMWSLGLLLVCHDTAWVVKREREGGIMVGGGRASAVDITAHDQGGAWYVVLAMLLHALWRMWFGVAVCRGCSLMQLACVVTVTVCNLCTALWAVLLALL
ncbi:hypothetical protein K439DRAFT_1622686 [Ramaria rubella]|nr:hypothetical protein K439DRAFT_1622686 [Ramaria rubella]